VRNAIAMLPTEQRQIIALAYFEELTQTEIARRIAIPLGTVKGRTRLAFKKLRGDAGGKELRSRLGPLQLTA